MIWTCSIARRVRHAPPRTVRRKGSQLGQEHPCWMSQREEQQGRGQRVTPREALHGPALLLQPGSQNQRSSELASSPASTGHRQQDARRSAFLPKKKGHLKDRLLPR